MESHFYKILTNQDFGVLEARGIGVSGSNFGDWMFEIFVSESNFGDLVMEFLASELNFGEFVFDFGQFDFEIWVRQSISPLRSNLVSRPKNLNSAPSICPITFLATKISS